MKEIEERQGLVQIYTGDGKGKTTAALGLSLRAAGHGLRTYIGQFMKGRMYGELDALRNFPLITVNQFGGKKCIRREEVSEADRRRASKGLMRCRQALHSGSFDLVVLDEILVAIWFDLLPLSNVVELVKYKPPQVELILTGRRAAQELIDLADLVTEMREIKHYYQKGIKARNGIER
ncbi:cob(I)yrinic acid a,c-diamide adenosyltransferase [candidate division KSB1 bacterium]|nr:cob(I)yrinic acid a,c-diamide adenosyltransferase [candidate division KSB1 bacterium]